MRVQDYTAKKWEPAMINQKCSQPRSYMVNTNTGSQYRINRRHISTTTEVFRNPERHNDESTTRDPTLVNRAEQPTCAGEQLTCVVAQPCVGEQPFLGEQPCVGEQPTCVGDAPYQTRSGRSVRPPNRIDL